MRNLLIIAGNTFREVIRDRVLYGLIVFTLLYLAFSIVIGQVSLDDTLRISANLGFTGIHISIMALAVFLGSTLVAKEIDKQTILTLLARPITRGQFIMGKALGLMAVLSTIGVSLSLILSVFLYFLEFQFDMTYIFALLGVLFEAALLLSCALFFGSFSRPMITVVFTVAVFMAGHWVDSLGYFISKSQSGSFRAIATATSYLIPDLERFNWRAAPVYGSPIDLADIGTAAGSMVGWVTLLIAGTVLIFRRRDFV